MGLKHKVTDPGNYYFTYDIFWYHITGGTQGVCVSVFTMLALIETFFPLKKEANFSHLRVDDFLWSDYEDCNGFSLSVVGKKHFGSIMFFSEMIFENWSLFPVCIVVN